MDNEAVVKKVLAHHGVKGMKWRVRKSHSGESHDVSVTTGRNRLTGQTTIKTKGGAHIPAHPDAVSAQVVRQKLAKSGSHALSNQEIKTLATRHQLESQIRHIPKRTAPHADTVNQIHNFLKSPEGKATVSVAKIAAKSSHVKKAIATSLSTAAMR